jgi:hypothetical protein
LIQAKGNFQFGKVYKRLGIFMLKAAEKGELFSAIVEQFYDDIA